VTGSPAGGGAGAPPVAGPPGTLPVALVGVTASGKSDVALDVARRFDQRRPQWPPGRAEPGSRAVVELVSVDSMAVYRYMDIGTTKLVGAERRGVKVHLTDVADPGDEFTVRQYQALARQALAGIAARGNQALLVGGTGLYLRSVVDGLDFPPRYPDLSAALEADLDVAGRTGVDALAGAQVALHRRLAAIDPVAASRIEPSNRRRLVRALEVSIGSGRPFSSYGPGLAAYPPTGYRLFGIAYDREAVDRRIAERFDAMLDAGLLAEVRVLAGRPEGIARTARQALGYRELLDHLAGKASLAEARDEAIRRTRAFARRQWAWFRRDPRIVWIDGGGDPAGQILDALESGACPGMIGCAQGTRPRGRVERCS